MSSAAEHRVGEHMEAFISEAEELIEEMTQSISGLDAGDTEKAEEFMRALHTLKGMAGMMGFRDMENLCHTMEDMLRRMDISGLYARMDSLEAMLQNIEAGASSTSEEMPAGENEASGLTEEDSGADKEQEEAEKKDGWTTYSIILKIKKKEPLKAVRAAIIRRDISSLGRITRFEPDPDKMEETFEGEIKVELETLLGPEKVLSSIMQIKGVEYARFEHDDRKNSTPDITPAAVRKMRTIRIDAHKIEELQSLVEEAVISINRVKDSPSPAETERLSMAIERLADRILGLRAVPVRSLIPRLHRIVKDTALKEGKNVILDVEGDDVEIDREVISIIGEALIHILRNAVSHGIEKSEERLRNGKPATGRIFLKFFREGSAIRIDVVDDGRGIDENKLIEKAREMGIKPGKEQSVADLIFVKGISTSSGTSLVSGRGVGMDTVKNIVEHQGGEIEVFSEAGKGTKFSIKLPFSTGIISALLVGISGKYFAIPTESIEKICEIESGSVSRISTEKFFRDGNRVHRMLDIYGETGKQVIIVRFRRSTLAIPVGYVYGIERIVLKRLEWSGSDLPFRYVTVLSDGDMAFVLEAASMGRMMEVKKK